MKSTQLIFVALLLFGAGVVSGLAGARLREKASARTLLQKRGGVPPPMWQRLEFLRRAQRDLDLTPEQRQRIEGYVKDSQEQIRRLWEPLAPRAKAEMDDLRQRIRGELSEAQRERFDQALAEHGHKSSRNPERGTNGNSRAAGKGGFRNPPPPPPAGP